MVDGQTTTLDQQLLLRGAITGVLTDADGAPVVGASVDARNVHTERTETATTDSEGRYRLALFDGEYYLSFDTPFGRQ